MAITTISDLRSALAAGARSNLFKVTITGQGVSLNESFTYLCKGAQLPSSTVGLIEVPFMAGRRYKLAGDRTFPEWTTTILNDAEQSVRETIEDLQRRYGATNYNDSGASKELNGSGTTDFSTLTVEQFDQAGNVTRLYKLENCWPTDISTIDLSYDSTDTIEEFTVTWAYDYFTVENQ